MRKTKDYGYVKIGVPEKLLDHFRRVAQMTDSRITDVARDYFENMVALNLKYEQPIDVTVSLNNFDLDKLKLLAGRSNMNVKEYVTRYYNDSKITPDEV